MTLPDDYTRGVERGVDKGRREVVDWMSKAMAFTNSENLPLNILRIDFKYPEWLEQLDKWGIKK